ncbi:MAG: CRISPR-associated endonuclease Cas2 [Fusobacteriaceae bacterium]
MRIIVFFDLPTITAKDRREYSQFRKGLLKEGFIMMQESVYTKLALNQSIMNLVKIRIKKIMPSSGLVQSLVITEKQFASIENCVGEYETNFLSTTERLVIL